MTRPTTEDLIHAHEDVEHLAYHHDPRTNRNPTAFPDLAALANLLVWYDTSIAHAREAAAHGPGIKDGYHTFGQQSQADIDVRTRDQYLKELRNQRGDLHHELGQLVDRHRQRAYDFGRYPDRSEQTG